MTRGKKIKRITGYLVQFSHEIEDGVEVWGNFVNILISGNAVENISMRLDEPVSAQAVTLESTQVSSVDESECSPLEFKSMLDLGLSEIKSKLKIKGKYEILEAKLCYLDVDEVLEGRRKLKGETRGAIPVWHLVVNPSYKGKGSLRISQHVWINAETGKLIGNKRY